MKVLGLLSVVTLVWAKPGIFPPYHECLNYDSCHEVDQNKINVHLVPHSHDDVGWLLTVDQYYYREVQQILTSVVEALMENTDRRFIQVETAFLYKWWNLQNDEVKTTFKQLVNEGRLEIVNGAWSMNDEATVHYQSTIDQYTLGLKFLEDNLGFCGRPKSSWQIDPFGHGREQASLLRQFDMDSLFFARFDYRDRERRLKNKTMEMLWTGSANLGSDSNIFTSALYNHYSPPPNFCFDIMCQDDPIIIDEDSFEYNWEAKVNQFTDFVKDQSQYYITNNIIITMGDDFRYQAASKNYINLDRLIEGFKKFNPKIDGKEVNMIYSTPSCYTKAAHDFIEAKNLTLELKTDDFFPYADEPNRVWTGYFTSRPSSKKLERLSNNFLQVSKQVGALAGKSYDSNFPLSQAMGVMQHHDAITGTELDDVEKDYHRQLARGIENITVEAGSAFSSILGLSKDLDLVSCPLINISVCSVAKKEDEFNLLVYNPLARKASHYIEIPVQEGTYEVKDPTGNIVESHKAPLINHFVEVPDKVGVRLVFKAKDLPALGYRVYRITKLLPSVTDTFRYGDTVEQMGFEDRYVNFDPETGYLKSITLFNTTLEVTQNFLYYKSSDVSNAYIFRPDNDQRDAIKLELIQNTVLVNDGNLIREVMQQFSGDITQIVRVYKDGDFIEFDWLIGSQNITGVPGREIITRYTTKLDKPSEEFYTDSNGREMIARKKNYRPTFEYSDEEPQSGNYYPINNRVVIKNENQEFAILLDRSQGGASLNPGEVELMVARQIGNSVNEFEYGVPIKIRGSHYVTLGDSANGDGNRTMAAVERDIAQRMLLQPWLFFTTDDIPVKEQSFLNRELQQNVHLLTLESWSEGAVLIRLEHILEKGEDPNLSKEVEVDLAGLFKSFNIKEMKEYTLAANIPLSESKKLDWSQLQPIDPDSILSKSKRLERVESDLNIALAPMQIRTFVATVEPTKSS